MHGDATDKDKLTYRVSTDICLATKSTIMITATCIGHATLLNNHLIRQSEMETI